MELRVQYMLRIVFVLSMIAPLEVFGQTFFDIPGKTISNAERLKLEELETSQDWFAIYKFAQSRLENEPEQPDWNYIAGAAMYKFTGFSDSIPFFQHAVFAENDNARNARIFMGLAYMYNGETEKAIRTFDIAIYRYPNSWEPYYWNAMMYISAENLEPARGYYEKLKPLNSAMALHIEESIKYAEQRSLEKETKQKKASQRQNAKSVMR